MSFYMSGYIRFSAFLICLLPSSAFAAPTGYKDNAWLYVLGFFAIAGLIGFGQLLTALSKRNLERLHEMRMHEMQDMQQHESSDSHTTEHK